MSVDFPRAGMLTSTQLEGLVTAGWRPPAGGDEAVEAARGDLRVRARPTAAPIAETCREVSTSAVVEEFAEGTIVVPGPEGAEIVVRDEFGTGRQELPTGRASAYAVTVLDGTEVVLDGRGAPTLLCPVPTP